METEGGREGGDTEAGERERKHTRETEGEREETRGETQRHWRASEGGKRTRWRGRDGGRKNREMETDGEGGRPRLRAPGVQQRLLGQDPGRVLGRRQRQIAQRKPSLGFGVPDSGTRGEQLPAQHADGAAAQGAEDGDRHGACDGHGRAYGARLEAEDQPAEAAGEPRRLHPPEPGSRGLGADSGVAGPDQGRGHRAPLRQARRAHQVVRVSGGGDVAAGRRREGVGPQGLVAHGPRQTWRDQVADRLHGRRTLFDAWVGSFPACKVLVDRIEANYTFWKVEEANQ
eukprot:2913744-Rhodomonas_salina.1